MQEASYKKHKRRIIAKHVLHSTLSTGPNSSLQSRLQLRFLLSVCACLRVSLRVYVCVCVAISVPRSRGSAKKLSIFSSLSSFFKVRTQRGLLLPQPLPPLLPISSCQFQLPVASCSPHLHWRDNNNNNGVWANLKLLFILKITYSSKKFRQLFTISTKDTRYET